MSQCHIADCVIGFTPPFSREWRPVEVQGSESGLPRIIHRCAWFQSRHDHECCVSFLLSASSSDPFRNFRCHVTLTNAALGQSLIIQKWPRKSEKNQHTDHVLISNPECVILHDSLAVTSAGTKAPWIVYDPSGTTLN